MRRDWERLGREVRDGMQGEKSESDVELDGNECSGRR